MRFFMLYSNQFAIGNKPIGIASLSAVLKRAGHQFRLFDCTAYRLTGAASDWNRAGEEHLEYMIPTNAGRLPARKTATFDGLLADLLAAIDEEQPDIIGLSALTDDYPLGLGLMRRVKAAFPGIPTIAGGVHAAVDPVGVISEHCFDLVCVGEGEYVVLDVADRIRRGEGFSGIANLWIKNLDGSVERNAVRPYETNLDAFPFPDWTIYPDAAFYKPFRGHVYKYGDFEMSRGCPFKCSYCINVHLQEVYKGHQYHREKSIPRVIAEIEQARDEYDIEFLKFWDETFLLMGRDRLEEFCDLYASRIGLPYVIETTGDSVDAVSARVLEKTNCRSVSLGMETGSPDMRKGLLHKPTGNSEYVKAFKLLEEHGIQKASFNMIGLPTESEADIFRTIAMNRLVRTEVQSVGVFYPYKGTPIRDMMVAEGWMQDDFDLTDLKDYDFSSFTAGNRSVVRFTDMDSRRVCALQRLFATYVLWPVILFPIIDRIKNEESEFAATLSKNVQRVSYLKKYGEWPPTVDPVAERAGAALPPEAAFADPEAAEFAGLLLRYWSGPGLDEIVAMLAACAAGTLKPQFEIPASPAELHAWLDITVDESAARETRAELRGLAKANAAQFAAGTFVPVTALRE